MSSLIIIVGGADSSSSDLGNASLETSGVAAVEDLGKHIGKTPLMADNPLLATASKVDATPFSMTVSTVVDLSVNVDVSMSSILIC